MSASAPREYYLRPPKLPLRHYDFVAFDTEGSGKKGDFKIAAVYDEDGPRLYTDPERLKADLFRYANRRKRIMACNLEYDCMTAFQDDFRGFDPYLSNGRWFVCYYRDGHDHTWTMWDLQRIAPLSVADMGDLIGLPKWPTPPDLRGHEAEEAEEWTCELHRRRWCHECYCARDAEICYQFAIQFQDTLNALGGEMKSTTASSAMDLFRRKYLTVEIPATQKWINDLARKAYFGGRVETYKVGTAREVNYYDFNSLYPAVMRDLELGDPASWHYLSNPRNPYRFLDKTGVLYAVLEIPRQYLPPLPVKIGKRIFYTTDVLPGAWPSAEVRRAVEGGARIIACDGVIWSDHTVQPFRKFVDDLWKLRLSYKKEGRADEYVVKLMLNSLYGKLGQKQDNELVHLVVPRGDYALSDFDGEPTEVGNREAFLEPVSFNRVPPFVHVPWAAAITGAARLRLYERMSSLEPEELFYADTDSIHTTAELPTGAGLGELKLVQQFARVTYFSPKEYKGVSLEGDEIVKSKGVPKRLQREYLERGCVEFRRPFHTLEALTTSSRIAEWHSILKERRSIPQTRRHRSLDDYNRRFVETRPYPFGEASDAGAC